MCNVGNRRRRSLIEADTEAFVAFRDITPSKTMSLSTRNTDSFENKTQSNKKSDTKNFVQHNYHDHAFDADDGFLDTPLVSRGGVTVPFPMKLHDMLDAITHHETHLESVVRWQPHGRCFVVNKPQEFADKVLTRFFQQKKYASFQRQLNLYGFNRITKGPDRGAYYHELFLRGKKFLCRGIHRMKVKGTGARMASNPAQEPNFYAMPTLPEKIKNAMPSRLNQVSPLVVSNSKVSSRKMPPLTLSSVARKSKPASAKTRNEEIAAQMDFVFGGMPFHQLPSQGGRRHSLMDPASRRNSIITPNSSECSSSSLELNACILDERFGEQLDTLSMFGERDLSDYEMGKIVDRIVDERVFR